MNFSREKNRENRNSFEHFERIIVFAIKIFNINPAKMEEIFFPRAEEGRKTNFSNRIFLERRGDSKKR